MILENIACRTVAGAQYILANVSMKCEGTSYYAYTYSFMLPLFFFLVFGIPALLFFYIKLKIVKKDELLKGEKYS